MAAFVRAVFFAAGGEENAREEDDDDDWNDKKRGSDAHSAALLAGIRLAVNRGRWTVSNVSSLSKEIRRLFVPPLRGCECYLGHVPSVETLG